LNGLGYVNSLRGNDDRALAAYRIAIERDPSNGFAYYNTGVTLHNKGDIEEAADAFYGAGLAYIKNGNYGPATKALADLKGLVESGLDRTEEIQTLENALQSLTKGEKRDA
jgi:tetratricopeptide (TPR) repeat protein